MSTQIVNPALAPSDWKRIRTSKEAYRKAKETACHFLRLHGVKPPRNEPMEKMAPQWICQQLGMTTENLYTRQDFNNAVVQWYESAMTSSTGKTVPKELKDGALFYKSTAWRELRYEALRLNALRHAGVYKCDCCGATGGTTGWHVDHIKSRSAHPDLALTPNNLQVLCEACNLGKGHRDSTDWRK